MWPLARCISSCTVRTPSPQLGVLQSNLRFISAEFDPLSSSHSYHPWESTQGVAPLLVPIPLQRPTSGIRRNLLTLNSCRSLPGSYAVCWVSNRIFPWPITPERTDNQNGPISGSRPICDSLLTISKTTGQCTCPWLSLRITIGGALPQESPLFIC